MRRSRHRRGGRHYQTALSTPLTIPIGKGAQSLTVSSSPSSLVTGQSATLSISGQSGTGLVTFAVLSGPCSISGATLTATAAGACSVTATIAADANWFGATSAALSVVVGKAAQNLTLVAPASMKTGETASLAVTGQSGTGAISYSVSGPCSIAGAIVTATGAGTCSATATIAADANYQAATSSVAQIAVGKGAQSLTLVVTPASLAVGQSAQLSVAGRRGTGSVSYALVSGACTLSGATLAARGAGTCVISASVAADADWEAATAAPSSVPIAKGAQTIVAASAAPSVLVGQSTTLSISGQSGAGAASYVLESGPCSLNGAVVTATGVGLCVIVATIAEDANYLAASARVTIFAGRRQTRVTLTASTLAPIYPEPVVLTATLDPFSATGVVTFRDGGNVLGAATLSGGVAQISVARLEIGAHRVVASYGGDQEDLPSTSAELAVTSKRPDPTTNALVREMLMRQTQVAQRAAGVQMEAVQNRLALLHRGEPPIFVNGLSFQSGSNLPAQTQAFGPQDVWRPGAQSAALAGIDQSLQRGTSPPLEAPLSMWTAGAITVGETRVEGIPERVRSRSQSIAFGADRKLTETFRAGAAVSALFGLDTLDQIMSSSRSRIWSAAAYQTWRVVDGFYLDTLVGAGQAQFHLMRHDQAGDVTLTGLRHGKLMFGSVSGTFETSVGAGRYALFARYDVTRIQMERYNETGSDLFGLSYGAAKASAQTLAIGVRGEYDISLGSSTIAPTFRAELRRTATSQTSQAISYTSDPATTFSVDGPSSSRASVVGGIGLKGVRGPLTGQFEYSSSFAAGGSWTRSLRGSLRLNF